MGDKKSGRPRFKVGDVVEVLHFDYQGGLSIEPFTAVVIDVFREVYHRLWLLESSDEGERPVDYGSEDILTIEKCLEEWLEGNFIKEDMGGYFELELHDTGYCNGCEYQEKCSKLSGIVRCDTSEFGQYRGAGKYDPAVCIQKDCRHRFSCATKRFIAKTDLMLAGNRRGTIEQS